MTVAQSDIEAILLRPLTVTEATYAPRLTEMAESQIESLLGGGFSIDSGIIDNEVIAYTDPSVVWTRRYPVTDVASLTVDGTEADVSTYRWNDKGRIEFGRWTSVNDFEINLTATTSSEGIVSYYYGVSPVPGDLAAAVAAVVASHLRRGATVPEGVTSESLGAYSVTYDTAANESGGLAPPAPALLRRWSRTAQVSVPLVR